MPNAFELLQSLINGLGIGLVYGLIAIGFCVIYNASGIVNFAQGVFVMLGGMYNSVMRALQQLGLADVYGESMVPLYVMNVAYPLIDDELVAFCTGKSAVLMVEEGAPEYIEQALNTILRRRDLQTKVSGKDVLPMGGEYTAQVMVSGMRAFLMAHAPQLLRNQPPVPDPAPILAHEKVKALAKAVPPRPPGFCIGCPERPIFAALKLVEKELGPHHVSADIGCGAWCFCRSVAMYGSSPNSSSPATAAALK